MKLLPSLFVVIMMATTIDGRFIRKYELPDEEKWVSLKQDVEFLAATNANHGVLDSTLRRQLESSASENFYNTQPFVDGESEYDEYQQAWRFLGFMIDCGEGYDDDGGSWEGTGEGCFRYLLWAAYVDLDYTGGGIGEYSYWDRSKQAWDTSPCDYRQEGSGDSGDNGYEDGTRCAKMDCHLEDTHFSLLGFFKHKSYDDWMEQLFKHEGMCVWSAKEYAFMKNAREAWPDGCAESSTTTADGHTIYYDVKPISGGGITLGLYTDTRCMEEYRGGASESISVDNVLGNFLIEGGSGDSQDDGEYDFSDYSLKQAYNFWDDSFDEWKICHPCVAYDLNNVGDQLTYYGENDDQYADDPENFDCYDDAGYTNVNQCMKFMAKTEMKAATFQDLSLASTQGTMVTNVPVDGYKDRSRKGSPGSALFTTIFFVLSMTVLAGGIYMFVEARNAVKDDPQFLKRPLVFT